MRFKIALVLGLLLAAADSRPALATFHEIMVKEVFAGSAAHPTAQYVLLQAYASGQNQLTGHSVLTFDATGAPTGTFTFSAIVPNPANQMTVFVATADAAAIFSLTADLAMTAVLDPAGGKACWDGSTPDDCVAWGNYTGSATGVGTPYNQAVGLIPGYAARRRLDICNGTGTLDVCDDTDDSASDFITATPLPITNPGVVGSRPPATCGNAILEGLEGCDGGAGCSATCHPVPAPLAPASLAVDLVPAADSNGNGVFDVGETVRVDTAWTNGGGGDVVLTGEITNFSGPTTGNPPFPDYRIVDGAAAYGTLTPAETRGCGLDSNCYQVTASATNRPSRHWDTTLDEILSNLGLKTWTLHIGNSFVDVDGDPLVDPFYKSIETIFHNGVTAGCGDGTTYCPVQNVLRQEMAVFLLKGFLGAGYVPPACTPPGQFTDVACPGLYTDFVEDLKTRGITGGCAVGPPALFCPSDPVTRAQMAPFLLKTLLGSAYTPPDCAGVFQDVPCPATPQFPFSNFIEDLKTRGITGGCAVGPPALYCPDNPVTREQMAAFLTLTFSLVLYGP
ncbi:MAG TPA: S-layer homology domain-containing protein [Thermoanaerobaculia bacterium]